MIVSRSAKTVEEPRQSRRQEGIQAMLLLFLAALSDPPAPPTLPASPTAKCERATNHLVGASDAALIRPLTEEPSARREYAVAYSEGGCMKPVTRWTSKPVKLSEPK